MAIELITGHAGATHVDSADFGAFNAGVVGPGIYILNGCECTVTSANTVLVSAGDLLCEGRHTRITGTGETLSIANGMSGYKRNDIVAAHYVKDGAGVESVTLTIVKGTAATGGQVDPALPATGKVLDGATDAYWPLYRIVIDGLTPQTPVMLADTNPIVTTGGGNAVPVENGGTGATNNADALTNLGFRYRDELKVTVGPGDQNWSVNAFEGFRDIPLSNILHVIVGTNVASNDGGWRVSWDTWEGRNRVDIYSPVYQDVWFNMLVIYEK